MAGDNGSEPGVASVAMRAPSARPERSPGEVLREAAATLEPRGAWTQGVWARARDGAPLFSGWDRRAACWCLDGAIEKVTGEDGFGERIAARAALDRTLPSVAAVSWNDTPGRRKSQVIGLLRKAAALADGALEAPGTGPATPGSDPKEAA